MVVITCLCGFGLIVHRVEWRDLGLIWAFNGVGMVIQDVFKVGLLLATGEERTYEALYLRQLAIRSEELYGDVAEPEVSCLSEQEEVKDEGSVCSSAKTSHSSSHRSFAVVLDMSKTRRAGPVLATTPGQMVASNVTPYPLVQNDV